MNETILLLTQASPEVLLLALAIEVALINVYQFSPFKEERDCIQRSMATRLAKGSQRKLKRVYYG